MSAPASAVVDVPLVPSAQPDTPEEVARRYAHRRPGFTLISYREVALPLWRLNLRVLTLARRPLPPIQEFALRTLDAGLRSTPRIAAFLGLEERVVVAALAELLSADLIVGLAPDPKREAAYTLTDRGRQVVIDCKIAFPETRQYPVFYDGLLRKIVPPGPVGGLRGRDLEAAGLLEIPPFPADGPEVGELNVQQLDELQRKLIGQREVEREFLEIQGIEGKRERQFKPAIALIYENVDSGERQVAFVVDTRLSTAHEQAFAAAEGIRKLGILEKIRTTASQVGKHLPDEVVALAVPSEEVDRIRVATEALRVRAETAAGQLVSAMDAEMAEVLRVEVEDARERLATAEASINAIQVRHLEVFEHPPLLQAALADAQNRLLIVSPWIRGGVVDNRFIESMESALARGVEIFLGYGLGADEGASDRDRAAEARLLELAARNPDSFHMTRLGDTHAKVLVVDQDFVVVTSFNWLSFKGDRNRPFRDERGLYVSLPSTVDEVFASLATQIRLGAAPVGTN
jgi:hypothetical protein